MQYLQQYDCYLLLIRKHYRAIKYFAREIGIKTRFFHACPKADLIFFKTYRYSDATTWVKIFFNFEGSLVILNYTRYVYTFLSQLENDFAYVFHFGYYICRTSVIRNNYKTGLKIAGDLYRIPRLHLENFGKARLLAISDFHNFFSK